MAAEPLEITVQVPPADARRLQEIAQGEGATVEAVALRVLHEGLAADVAVGLGDMFDATPGFYERFMASVDQARRGETIPASELRGP